MLKQLLPLLRKGDTIGLSIAMEGDNQYRVNVLPKLFTLDGDKGTDRAALNTPMMVEGTAEELDSPEFIETITRFTNSATTLRHTIDEVEATHKSAGEKKKPAAVDKAADKKTTPAKPEKPKVEEKSAEEQTEGLGM